MKASHAQLALFRSLRTRKGREETGLFLVEGKRLCAEILEARVPAAFLLLSARKAEEGTFRELAERYAASGARVLLAPTRNVERVSDAVHGQGIVAAARWGDVALSELRFPARALVVALDRVADPGNVGTVVRTAAWFGAAAVLLGEGCADLLNPKTVRSTMGGMFHVPVLRNVDLAAALPDLGRSGFTTTVATTDGAPDWRSWRKDERSVLLLGSEAHGVEATLRRSADRDVGVPRTGAGESLNVAVCAGILIAAGQDFSPLCK